MRRFYAVILAHCVASYAALAHFVVLFRFVRGDQGMRIYDGHDVVKLVLYPVLQLLIVPHYVMETLHRRDPDVTANLLAYLAAFVASYLLLRRVRLGKRSPGPV